MRGKFGEHQTVRSILKSLPATNNRDVQRAGIGDDYARLLFHSEEAYGGLQKLTGLNVATGSITTATDVDMELDVARLYNSIRIGGFIPWGATDMLIVPDSDERAMKRLLKRLALRCSRYGIDIVHGHTEVNTSVSEPVVCLTVFGKPQHGRFDVPTGKTFNTAERKKESYDVVMCGQAGLGGTLSLYYNNREGLEKRYSQSYLHPVERLSGMLALDSQADIAIDHGVIYCHDISRGGVYAALWELGDALKTGFEVCHDSIPILQETIEICEYTGDNPYMIDGCGGAIFVTKDGQKLADLLYEEGYEAAVIGVLKEGMDRVVVHEDERRFLTPPKFI